MINNFVIITFLICVTVICVVYLVCYFGNRNYWQSREYSHFVSELRIINGRLKHIENISQDSIRVQLEGLHPEEEEEWIDENEKV